jgi:hypothetical protein
MKTNRTSPFGTPVYRHLSRRRKSTHWLLYWRNPTTGRAECKFEHRQVWEDSKAPIPRGCCIHHKDGDGLNNAIANLELLTCGGHFSLHLTTHGLTTKAMLAAHGWGPYQRMDRTRNPEKYLAKDRRKYERIRADPDRYAALLAYQRDYKRSHRRLAFQPPRR